MRTIEEAREVVELRASQIRRRQHAVVVSALCCAVLLLLAAAGPFRGSTPTMIEASGESGVPVTDAIDATGTLLDDASAEHEEEVGDESTTTIETAPDPSLDPTSVLPADSTSSSATSTSLVATSSSHPSTTQQRPFPTNPPRPTTTTFPPQTTTTATTMPGPEPTTSTLPPTTTSTRLPYPDCDPASIEVFVMKVSDGDPRVGAVVPINTSASRKSATLCYLPAIEVRMISIRDAAGELVFSKRLERDLGVDHVVKYDVDTMMRWNWETTCGPNGNPSNNVRTCSPVGPGVYTVIAHIRTGESLPYTITVV